MGRVIFFSLWTFLLLSCGQKKEERPLSENSNSRCVSSLEECQKEEDIHVVSDSQSVELLESTLDIPIEIFQSSVIFLSSKSSSSRGRKFICDISSREQETFRFDLTGDILDIFSEEGHFKMKPLTDAGEGLMRSWIWRGQLESGMRVTKQFSFIHSNRLIMRKTCEM